jgi:hypothetical protein
MPDPTVKLFRVNAYGRVVLKSHWPGEVSRGEPLNRIQSLVVANQRTMILPLLGERAGVRVSSLLGEERASDISRFMVRESRSNKNAVRFMEGN